MNASHFTRFPQSYKLAAIRRNANFGLRRFGMDSKTNRKRRRRLKNWISLLTLAIALPGAIPQAQTLIITGVKTDGVFFIQEVLPNTSSLDLRDRYLTELFLPDSLTNLDQLYLDNNQLSSLTLPDNLTRLKWLSLSRNRLSSLALPNNRGRLNLLNLSRNQLTSFQLPDGLTDLETLYLSGNQLDSFALPEDLESLQLLSLGGNQLSALTIPQDLTRLEWLTFSPLTAVSYPNDWTLLSLNGKSEYGDFHLEVSPVVESLSLRSRGWTSLTLPEGLTRLKELNLSDNPLRRLLIPRGMNVENMEVHGFSKSEITRYFAKARISIRPAENGQWTVECSDGILQTTKSLLGQWKDHPELKSPFLFSPSAPQKFFRVCPAF